MGTSWLFPHLFEAVCLPEERPSFVRGPGELKEPGVLLRSSAACSARDPDGEGSSTPLNRVASNVSAGSYTSLYLLHLPRGRCPNLSQKAPESKFNGVCEPFETAARSPRDLWAGAGPALEVRRPSDGRSRCKPTQALLWAHEEVVKPGLGVVTATWRLTPG